MPNSVTVALIFKEFFLPILKSLNVISPFWVITLPSNLDLKLKIPLIFFIKGNLFSFSEKYFFCIKGNNFSIFKVEGFSSNLRKKFGLKFISPLMCELISLLLINPSFIFILSLLTKLSFKKLFNISKLSEPRVSPELSFSKKTLANKSNLDT